MPKIMKTHKTYRLNKCKVYQAREADSKWWQLYAIQHWTEQEAADFKTKMVRDRRKTLGYTVNPS